MWVKVSPVTVSLLTHSYSDGVVIGTDTVAVRQDDGSFKLHGYKWFTSATDANVAFTLARVQDTQGLVTPVWDLPRIRIRMRM